MFRGSSKVDQNEHRVMVGFMMCIETITPESYERSSITPVSMGLHSIKKTSRDGVHVLTKAAAKIFCQGVSSTRVFFRGHDLMAKEV